MMALVDLIRKRATGAEAKANWAIEANHGDDGDLTLARLAPIALAPTTNDVLAKPQARENVLDLLRLFRFDLVAHDIEDGYPVDDLERVNNMAWEFMQVDGMKFSEALHLAAEIVTERDVVVSEAAYEDVRALWLKVTRNLD
jgi:hypothetical protein